MEAKRKLEEARYFVKRIEECRNAEDEFLYNLSGFLNAWRSIVEVMLYDFAERYSLGLTRQQRITPRDFEIAAQVLGRTEASRFLEWWRRQVGSLGENPLSEKRNVSFHRGYPKVERRYSLYVSTPGVSSTLVPYYASFSTSFVGSNVTTTTTTASPHYSTQTYSKPSYVGQSDEYYFDDISDRTVLEVCKEGIDKMKDIVEKADREPWTK